jgi:hypothetical protein
MMDGTGSRLCGVDVLTRVRELARVPRTPACAFRPPCHGFPRDRGSGHWTAAGESVAREPNLLTLHGRRKYQIALQADHSVAAAARFELMGDALAHLEPLGAAEIG